MSGIEKRFAAEVAETLSKIVRKTAEGYAAGHHKIANHISDAASQIEKTEREVADKTAGLGGKAGEWRSVNESMSGRARDYQEQVTGHRGEAYEVLRPSGRPVRFDGYEDGTLIDAKGPGYSALLRDRGPGKLYPRKSVIEGLETSAKNQVEAARGRPIEWRVAEPDAAVQIERILAHAGYTGRIEVTHVPSG
ncbi:MAG: Tox-REase-5 domain-containing protein [Pseudonocardiaceae bacterium]